MRKIASFAASVNSASTSLQAANARLQTLRAEMQGGTRLPHGERWQQTDGDVVDGALVSHSAENTASPTNGWLDSLREAVVKPVHDLVTPKAVIIEKVAKQQVSATHITTYGTIAAAILKHDGGTVGRIWLVLRANFAREEQSGMVSADSLQQCLTQNFPQYTQKHLRDLLNRGEGVYWQRDANDRLWLTGVTKVAAHLGVERLQGIRVIVPLTDLTGKLTKMRTALQAAFHVSRDSNSPISRATLRDLTGISERSQREQESQHAELIEATANYSLDKRSSSTSTQEHAFHYHQNSFQFTDSKGKQGQQGGFYLAHQLPNSYTARYQCANRGRKRKINRRLTSNRVNQGARGTGWQKIDKVFYNVGSEAVRSFNRDAERVAYPTHRTRRGTRIWITL